jgi:hypothetical protein
MHHLTSHEHRKDRLSDITTNIPFESFLNNRQGKKDTEIPHVFHMTINNVFMILSD